MVKGIVPKHGGNDLRNSSSKEESEEIWRGRRVRLVIGSSVKLPLLSLTLVCFAGCSLVYHGTLTRRQVVVDRRLRASQQATGARPDDAGGSCRVWPDGGRSRPCWRRVN